MEEGDHPSSSSEDGSRLNARTYDCTFCKRGFSNAQALGGHMNIHRKDRAKIKQPPNVPLNPFTPANYLPLAHGGDEGSSLKWPQRILGRKADGSSSSSSSRELPLFMAPPSQDDDDQQAPRGSSSDHQIISRHRRGAVELDLELRLGTTEPRES